MTPQYSISISDSESMPYNRPVGMGKSTGHVLFKVLPSISANVLNINMYPM